MELTANIEYQKLAINDLAFLVYFWQLLLYLNMFSLQKFLRLTIF